MKTDNAICLEDREFRDGDKVVQLKRGKEYIISEPNKSGEVTVFNSYWFQAPKSLFGGVQKFT